MTARDWAAEARERWPGCEVSLTHRGSVLMVGVGAECYAASESVAGEWMAPCRLGPGIGSDPIAAIEAAIRAEQDEARATLERLKCWGVP